MVKFKSVRFPKRVKGSGFANAVVSIIPSRVVSCLVSPKLTGDQKEAIKPLVEAVDQIERGVIGGTLPGPQFRASEIDDDGLPKHGSFSNSTQGQFLRLTSLGAGQIITLQPIVTGKQLLLKV